MSEPPGATGGGAKAPGAALEPEPLLRELGVFGIWALAINGTIGAGIFGAPALVAAETGAWSPLVFLLGGLLLAPVVLSFAEVASAFGGTGGPVLYTRTAFGPLAGFQVGWTFYIARVSASAANVSLLVASLGWFWPAAERGGVRLALLLVVCGLLTWVNVVGTRHAMRSLGGLTLLKFLPLVALVGFGLPRLELEALPFATPEPAPTAGQLGAAVMLSIYAFVGWESALVPAGESRDPGRDMPRALLWALATATLLYVGVQAVSVSALPDLARTAERPLVAVGEALLGPPGAVLLTLGVIVSVAGNVASAVMSTPRITYAMARVGLLPRFFGGVHATFQTPSASILIYGGVFFALAATGTFAELARISVLTRLLIYLSVIAAAPRLRARDADVPGRLRLPGGLAIHLVAGLVCLALLSQVGWPTVWRTALYLAVGTLLYLVARRAPASRAGGPAG